MATEKQNLGIGVFLLAVSTVVILAIADTGSAVPAALGGAATLTMAAGALIVGLYDGTGV